MCDRGGGAAGHDRRAAALVVAATGRPARHRRPVRPRRRSGSSRSPTTATRRALPPGGGSAQALGRLEQGAGARRSTSTSPGRRPTRRSADGWRRIARRWRSYRQGTERPDAFNPAIRPMPILQAGPGPLLVQHTGPAGGVPAGGAGATWRGPGPGTARRLARPTTWACAGHRLPDHGRRPTRRASRSVEPWAADPRTTPALLRRALDDVVACGAFTPSESYMLKAEYPSVDRTLDDRITRAASLIVARLSAALNSAVIPAGPGSGPGDRRCLAILASGAGAEPSGDPAGHRQLAGLSRPTPGPSPAPRIRACRARHEFYALGPEAPAQAPRPVARGPRPMAATQRHDAQELISRWDLRALPPAGAGQAPGSGDLAGERALPPRPRDRSALGRGAGRALPQGTPRRWPGRCGSAATPRRARRREPGFRPSGSDHDGDDFEPEPQLPDAEIPGRAVPVVLPQPSAGVDRGGVAAGDDRRAADLVVAAIGRPARHRRAVRSSRRSGSSRSPTTATPTCSTARRRTG